MSGRHGERPGGKPVPQFLRDYARQVADAAASLDTDGLTTGELDRRGNEVLAGAERLRQVTTSEAARRVLARDSRHRGEA